MTKTEIEIEEFHFNHEVTFNWLGEYYITVCLTNHGGPPTLTVYSDSITPNRPTLTAVLRR